METLYRQALPRSAQVLFQNADDLELFRNRNLLGSTPFSVVAGSGIDLEHFAPSALPGEAAVTFLMIARLLRDKGVKDLYLCAVHPVFSGRASSLLPELGFKRVLVSDTQEPPAEVTRRKEVQVVKAAPILARAVLGVG